VTVERNRGIVSVVGTGLADGGKAMACALTAIGDIQVHMLSLSASGINLTVVVDGEQVTPAMQRLHAAVLRRLGHLHMSAVPLALIGMGKMGRALAGACTRAGAFASSRSSIPRIPATPA
jgi:hypothetical protein